ncbi:MAG TPA: TIR domain-containing protein [Actinophytocola sp.]|uniref:TIR domain-containing protein n=1 Tax=Actinophytocola sp. TaxID=1872138 RepID=UPI002E0C48CB|nr:TIR domain-containing protein [Actinophytocola sp.]
MYETLTSAFERAGIEWSQCLVEDRGDGMFILAAPHVPKHLFVDALPQAIIAGLRQHNAVRAVSQSIRLRMAVHAGEVAFDSHGTTGVGINLAFRLLEAADLRRAMAESSGLLGIIVSDWYYHEVVCDGHGDTHPDAYQPVRVAVKETTANAWIYLPDVSANHRIRVGPGSRRPDFLIAYAAMDRAWTEWISWQLEMAGCTTLLDATEFAPGQNFAIWVSDALDRADRLIVVLSPAFARSAVTMSEVAAAFRDSRLLPVRVAPLDSPVLTSNVRIDLTGVNERTAHQRLIDGTSQRAKPRSAPPYPGQPALADTPVIPVFPGSAGRLRPHALVVHALPDADFATELSNSLRVLETEESLCPVESRPVGQLDEETESYIDELASRAEIVLILVSRALLASGYGSSAEMGMLTRRLANRDVILLPVILRPTSWERQPFGRLAALPSNGVPVSHWTSQDEAIKNIVNGVRLAVRSLRGEEIAPVPPVSVVGRQVFELGEVFKPTGMPTATFVEPDDFFEFRMALRQPGLGVILEGPAGVGKTTVLRQAVDQDADRLREPELLSARKPADVPTIRQLLGGHTGLVAVDDFQRLPADLQDDLADYLKVLADDDAADGKLVLVGIPGTAQGLIDLSPDLATRIRRFRLGRVSEEILLQMMTKGEAALNIIFDRKVEVAIASMGSLQTAQMLCWSMVTMAGIDKTADVPTIVHTDIARARVKVAELLRLKFQSTVEDFIVLDDPDELLCIELLLELARTSDGILRLGPFADRRPDLRDAIERVFIDGMKDGLAHQHKNLSKFVFYDPRNHRLVVDDPQFVFYLCQLSRAELLDAAGKRMPVPRNQVFISYSHKDAAWKDRVCLHLRPSERAGTVETWTDDRIAAGDVWRKEIAAALDRARVALLLISADFFGSDYIHSDELPPLLAAAEKGGCRIIPVLVGPSRFHDIPELARFQSMPSATTLGELTKVEADRTLVELARAVEHALTAGNPPEARS